MSKARISSSWFWVAYQAIRIFETLSTASAGKYNYKKYRTDNIITNDNNNTMILYRWRCLVPSCKKTRSLREGSFFAKSKLSLQKWLVLLHWWCREYPMCLMLLRKLTSQKQLPSKHISTSVTSAAGDCSIMILP